MRRGGDFFKKNTRNHFFRCDGVYVYSAFCQTHIIATLMAGSFKGTYRLIFNTYTHTNNLNTRHSLYYIAFKILRTSPGSLTRS